MHYHCQQQSWQITVYSSAAYYGSKYVTKHLRHREEFCGILLLWFGDNKFFLSLWLQRWTVPFQSLFYMARKLVE